VGLAPKVDVAVIVPLITATLEARRTPGGREWQAHSLAETNTKFSGIGDMAAVLKVKAAKLPGPENPDSGRPRIPDHDAPSHRLSRNLRGLGVYRTAAPQSSPRGRALQTARVRGFEFWSKSVDVPTADANGGLVKVRHQVRFNAGLRNRSPPESHAAPRFPRAEDQKGARWECVSDPVPANANGISSIQSLVESPEGILKGILVPGIKVNLKGKLLLSLNALVTVKNNGLHSKVTPVVGLNLGL
jgi:hypothetical protein